MPEDPRQPGRQLMSMRAYARHRGVLPMTVHQAVKAGRLVKCVVKDAAGKFIGITDPFLADKEWAENTDVSKAPPKEQAKAAARDAAFSGSSSAGSEEALQGAANRKHHWDAELKRLKYLEAAGELVPKAAMTRRLADEYSACRTRLLAIPSRAKQALPELTVPQVATLENLIREALSDLADAESIAAEARAEEGET